MRITFAAALAAAALAAPPALAADKDKEVKRPEVFDKLIACRTIADGAARLACFDAQVARLDEAAAKNEVVVVDRAEVRKARKGLFGLSLPDLGNLFGGGKDGAAVEEVNEIESTIRSVGQDRSGKWMFIIEDGARWVQTDTSRLRTPKPGMKIRIRKAAMGSYFANVEDRPGIKVRREN